MSLVGGFLLSPIREMRVNDMRGLQIDIGFILGSITAKCIYYSCHQLTIFSCGHATLDLAMSVGRLVGRSVGRLVGMLVRHIF